MNALQVLLDAVLVMRGGLMVRGLEPPRLAALVMRGGLVVRRLQPPRLTALTRAARVMENRRLMLLLLLLLVSRTIQIGVRVARAVIEITRIAIERARVSAGLIVRGEHLAVGVREGRSLVQRVREAVGSMISIHCVLALCGLGTRREGRTLIQRVREALGGVLNMFLLRCLAL